jgi:3-deoxy-D-manno-octulosonic-acid transferase
VTFLYTPLLYLFLPVLLIRLVWRGFKNPDYWHRWRERFGFIERLQQPVDVWVHAVSVGEVRAAEPLVNALLDKAKSITLLVTTMTPTGSAQVRQCFGDRVHHCYVPYDYPAAVNRFIDKTRPHLAVFMETEMWPNIIRLCSRRAIPLLFANVRLSEKSFYRYQRVVGFMGPVLRLASGFAAQTHSDAERLKRLGAREESVRVTGSIKFEVKLPASLIEVAKVLRREWGSDRLVWIAASTHEGEDETLLAAFAELKQNHPNLLLVIVPRHPERFAAVARLCHRAGYKTVLRSQDAGPLSRDVDIFIGDSMGELNLFYAASDIAFVGGSLVPVGGHNVLEPCALGLPVVFGPHMFNFQEIGERTLAHDAGMRVADKGELTAAIDRYLADPNLRFKTGEAGKAFVAENRGALQKTLHLLEDYIPELNSNETERGQR